MKRVRALLDGAAVRRAPDVERRPARRRRADHRRGRRPAAQGPARAGRPARRADPADARRRRPSSAWPPEAQLDRPVTLRPGRHRGDDVVWGQLVVEVGAFAKATVVLDHTGLGEVLRRRRGPGRRRRAGHARLGAGLGARRGARRPVRRRRRPRRHASSRSWSPSAATSSGWSATCSTPAPAARPTSTASTSPTRPSTRSTGSGSTTPCRTAAATSLYKGALQGEDARTVWIGDVRIRPAATGTDTYELNRNLVLTDGARADSVPNLEIETGEIVGAGHASATGRFDDEQLFYLCSRGIDAETARRLVVRGFFADVVQHIGAPRAAGPADGHHRGPPRRAARAGGAGGRGPA